MIDFLLKGIVTTVIVDCGCSVSADGGNGFFEYVAHSCAPVTARVSGSRQDMKGSVEKPRQIRSFISPGAPRFGMFPITMPHTKFHILSGKPVPVFSTT